MLIYRKEWGFGENPREGEFFFRDYQVLTICPDCGQEHFILPLLDPDACRATLDLVPLFPHDNPPSFEQLSLALDLTEELPPEGEWDWRALLQIIASEISMEWSYLEEIVTRYAAVAQDLDLQLTFSAFCLGYAPVREQREGPELLEEAAYAEIGQEMRGEQEELPKPLPATDSTFGLQPEAEGETPALLTEEPILEEPTEELPPLWVQTLSASVIASLLMGGIIEGMILFKSFLAGGITFAAKWSMIGTAVLMVIVPILVNLRLIWARDSYYSRNCVFHSS